MRIVESIITVRAKVEHAAYVARIWQPSAELDALGVRVRVMPEMGDAAVLCTVYTRGSIPNRERLDPILGRTIRVAQEKALRQVAVDNGVDQEEEFEMEHRPAPRKRVLKRRRVIDV